MLVTRRGLLLIDFLQVGTDGSAFSFDLNVMMNLQVFSSKERIHLLRVSCPAPCIRLGPIIHLLLKCDRQSYLIL